MLLLLIFNTMIHSWAWILWLQHVWWVAMGTAKPWCHHGESDWVLLRCHLRDSDLTQVVWQPTKIAYTCNAKPSKPRLYFEHTLKKNKKKNKHIFLSYQRHCLSKSYITAFVLAPKLIIMLPMLQFLHRWCLPFNDETQLPTITFPSISAQPCGTGLFKHGCIQPYS